MADSGPRSNPAHRGPERVHQRPADRQDEANRPMEPKARPGELADRDHEPGEGPGGPRDDPPHHSLTNPARDPDPTAAGDPYERDPEAGDPPPPGEYPGPGPEPPREERERRDESDPRR